MFPPASAHPSKAGTKQSAQVPGYYKAGLIDWAGSSSTTTYFPGTEAAAIRPRQVQAAIPDPLSQPTWAVMEKNLTAPTNLTPVNPPQPKPAKRQPKKSTSKHQVIS